MTATGTTTTACATPFKSLCGTTEALPSGCETLPLETAVMDLWCEFGQVALDARQATPCPASPTYLALLETGHTISSDYFRGGRVIYRDKAESIMMLQQVTRCIRSLHALARQDQNSQDSDPCQLVEESEHTAHSDAGATDQIPLEWAGKVDGLINLTREVALQMNALWDTK